jgi:uncharacterized protein (TIGR01244 family)
MIRHINESISVAPQIAVEHVADIAAAGFKTIVNNRPDDEDAGQPSGDAIRAVTHAGFSHPQIDAMTQALTEAKGPVLAYCRSGTRSCNLWALAAAKAGRNPNLLLAQAEDAGYDLRGIRPMLDALAGPR